MQEIDTHQQQKIMEFIRLSGINNFPHRDTPEDEFLTVTYRYADIIDAYNGCSKIAAQAYLSAQQTALTLADLAADQNEVYCNIMAKEFYDIYIQYKWNQVKTNQRQTSVLSQVLYSEYLNALDVHLYVDYTPLLCA